ncbi:hypothetical protein GCM10017779_33370 [Streptomyces capillispiralis]|nr:hypothetical protein GCM10017779_33370 [Streptomyces capillispiralis]
MSPAGPAPTMAICVRLRMREEDMARILGPRVRPPPRLPRARRKPVRRRPPPAGTLRAGRPSPVVTVGHYARLLSEAGAEGRTVG